MANSVSVNTSNKDLWAGGAEPYKASYGKLMMWFFLISDAFTFSAFLIAYGVIRFRHPGYEGTLPPIEIHPLVPPLRSGENVRT